MPGLDPGTHGLAAGQLDVPEETGANRNFSTLASALGIDAVGPRIRSGEGNGYCPYTSTAIACPSTPTAAMARAISDSPAPSTRRHSGASAGMK